MQMMLDIAVIAVIAVIPVFFFSRVHSQCILHLKRILLYNDDDPIPILGGNYS